MKLKMVEIIFGIIAGIITGMGMGGGAILILLLGVFLGLDQHIAQATNLVFFIPTALSAILINLKQKNVNIKLAITVSAFGIVGAIIGTIISDKIPSANLRKYFAIFILIIAFHEIYRLYKEYIIAKTRNNKKRKK
jgi:hypothetical protein